MILLLILVSAVLAAPFQVTVPNNHLMAVRGRPVVLGCTFTPDSDISNLVVTWQRQEDSRVVHSFYYQKDQLDQQSPEYHNRTSLDKSELSKGNASLKITAIGPQDTGQYMCIVSNGRGTGRAFTEVTYGALYSEPKLNIHINASVFILQFETEGFPKPEVMWLGEKGENLTQRLELLEKREDGLYFIKSIYEAQKPVVNVTFTLKNRLLNQNLQRPVILTCEKDTGRNPAVTGLIVLSVLCATLLIGIVFLTLRGREKTRFYRGLNHHSLALEPCPKERNGS